MKGVQCYELFGGIALKNHAFSFLISLKFYFKLFKTFSIASILMVQYTNIVFFVDYLGRHQKTNNCRHMTLTNNTERTSQTELQLQDKS